MKVTAPDPDGARYSALRLADPGCHVLVRLYDDRCRSMGRAPQDWKDSTTVLVHKGGDRDVLHNWRTMMLSNTIGKLYSPVLADRISKWATDGGRLSPEQKIFTDHEGCLEHNFVLQTEIEDARRRGEGLCVAWLDLDQAFGSVPHSHILGTLQLLGGNVDHRRGPLHRLSYPGIDARRPVGSNSDFVWCQIRMPSQPHHI